MKGERMALEEQSQEDRDRFQQEILRRIQQKKMKYSAMEIDNNVMMNDIIKEEEVEVTSKKLVTRTHTSLELHLIRYKLLLKKEGSIVVFVVVLQDCCR